MKVIAVFLCLSAVSVVCWAQPLLRYGASTSDQAVTGCDDCNTGAQRLMYGNLQFMGQEQQYYAVHANGYVTFPQTSSVSSYSFTPSVLSTLSGSPMIAPYWADADLRGSGTVFYRESICDEDRNDSAAIIRTKFGGNYMPNSVITVTWINLGYYSEATDLLNTFQMVIAFGNGKTYLILMYNQLQWTTGSASGGSGGLGGTVAQAGYSSAGLGVGSVSLPGSGTPAILNLPNLSNSQITGTFVFCVDDSICMDTQIYPQPIGLLERVRASLLHKQGYGNYTGGNETSNGTMTLQKGYSGFSNSTNRTILHEEVFSNSTNRTKILQKQSSTSTRISMMIMEEHLNKH